MEKQEVHGLLVQISHLDQRVVDEGTVHMWWEILAPYSYALAREAVPICFMESDSYLTPHRLVAVVRRLREVNAVAENKKVIYGSSTERWMPNNFAEISDFYRRLYLAHPWGDGGSADGMAADVGWLVPAPVWDD
jgi:hypothetical protein